MLSMDRDRTHLTFAPRQPRTKSTRKPRMCFPELDEAINPLYTPVKANVPSLIDLKKGSLLQETATPSNRSKREFLQDEGTSSGSFNAYKAYDASKADDGHAFESSHKGDEQRERYESDHEDGSTRVTSHESSDDFDASGKSVKHNVTAQKRCHSVHTKDLNQLAREVHIDKVRSKPGSSNRTQSNRGDTTSRMFNDDINRGACLGHGDNGITSRGQHPSRTKYNMEQLPRAKLGLNTDASLHSKLEPKRGDNKALNIVGKKSSSLKVDGITHQSDKGAHLIPELEKKKKALYETVSPSRKSTCTSEARRRRHHTNAQETSDIVGMQKCRQESSGEDAIIDLNGKSSPEIEQHTHGNGGFGALRTSGMNDKVGLPVPTVRKSSRVPKKRIFDGDEEEPLSRQRKKLEIEPAVEFNVCAEQDEAMDMAGDDQLLSECLESKCHKGNDISGPFLDEQKELQLTARQCALRFSKEGRDSEVCTIMNFPDGLQQVVPKKQKENLTEAEQAIKKEAAARRRKQQMERSAKEIQANAIQKILGQESSRKKREEKLQKQRQEIEQEKQAASLAPAVNSIRWVMGPSGNIVSFSQDVELPKIFSGPCSYPQEREKCAGPSCNNAYKYRDSKTRLPLCSLQCYRAVQEVPSSGPAF